MNAKFLFAAFCLLGFVASMQASNVADLTDSSSHQFVGANEFVLVEFYAPWCGHCKQLAPEYEKAADQLLAEGSPVKLAKVDCTVQQQLAEEFKIQGYPTLQWFRNGKPVEYNGPREASGIVGWVTKKSGPSTHTLTDKAQLDAHIAKGNAVVGFFEKDSEAHKAFVAASQNAQTDAFTFIDILSEDLIKEAGESVGTVKLYRTFDEPLALEGEVTEQAIVNLVTAHGFPYFEPAPNAWARLMGRGLEYVLLIVADVTEEDVWTPINEFASKLAKQYADKVGFAYLTKDFFPRVTQFGLSGKNFPAALIMAPQREKTFLFPEETPLTEEAIKSFVDGVLDGTITPKFKSDEAPESNDGPVTILVGTTFEELVINNDKDVLVEFYAPWCGHCKSLEPIYEALGKRFADNDKVVIAKMDSTTNDNDHVSVKGFPTIVFFPAGSKDKPITYEGPRTVDGFVSFLNEHATNLQGKPIAAADDDHDEL
jgi:protein disulfide-isomerase A1